MLSACGEAGAGSSQVAIVSQRPVEWPGRALNVTCGRAKLKCQVVGAYKGWRLVSYRCPDGVLTQVFRLAVLSLLGPS